MINKSKNLNTEAAQDPKVRIMNNSVPIIKMDEEELKKLSTEIVCFLDLPGKTANDLNAGKTLRTLKQSSWELYYHFIYSGIIPGSNLSKTLPGDDQLQKNIKDAYDDGVIPIALAFFEYHGPNLEFMKKMDRASKENRPLEMEKPLGTYLQKRKTFFASSLVPLRKRFFSHIKPMYRGLQVKFLLNEKFYLSNITDSPVAVSLDFDDGQGLRKVSFGQSIQVDYLKPGKKKIRVECLYPDTTISGDFIFEIAEKDTAAALIANDIWDLHDNSSVGDGKAAGTAYVFFGKDLNGNTRTCLEKPFIFADGFPGHKITDLIGSQYLNQENFLNGLLDGGYDTIIITYGDRRGDNNNGTDYIENNAGLAVDCIQQAITNCSGFAQLVCGGASMGGLVMRYALTWMEAQALNHECSIFYTFDTPHQGAFIPVSVQFYLRVLNAAGRLPSGNQQDLQDLNSNAAKQMLRYYLDNIQEGERPLTSSSYTSFFNNLSYPNTNNIINIAIADGSCRGVPMQPDHSEVVSWNAAGGIGGRGSAYTLPQSPDDNKDFLIGDFFLLPFFGDPEYSSLRCFVNYTDDFETAPGGTREDWQELANGLDDTKCVSAICSAPINCFVPSVSALDIATNTPNVVIPRRNASTPFDKYWIGSRNLPHTKITYSIKHFIYRVLGIEPEHTGELTDLRECSSGEDFSYDSFYRTEQDCSSENGRQDEEIASALCSFSLKYNDSDNEFRNLYVSSTFYDKKSLCLDRGVERNDSENVQSSMTSVVLAKQKII